LISSEPDLKARNAPMVFPIFGRGRFLPGMIGKGINPSNIGFAAESLIQRCLCETKRAHPGFELLLAADWDALKDDAKVNDPPLPELVDTDEPAGAEQAKDGDKIVLNVMHTRFPLIEVLLLIVGAGVLVAVAGTVVIFLRGKGNGRNSQPV
jgi:hypothetical protein